MENKIAPLQVYLDAADYSTLSDPIRLEKEPKKADALRYIEGLVGDRRIEIRFSGHLFGEIAQLSSESKPFAVKRAKLLDRLCQGKTIINCFQLIEAEIQTYAKSGALLQRSDVYREKSNFFDIGFSLEDAENYRRTATKTIHDIISQNSHSRSQRRMLEAQYLKGDYLRPSAITLLKGISPNKEPDLADFLIEMIGDRDELFYFLSGSKSAKNFYLTLLENFMNPVTLIEHILDARPELQEKLFTAVRAQAIKLSSSLQNSMDKLDLLKRDFGHPKYSILLEEVIDESLMDVRNQFITKWAGAEFQLELLAKPMGSFPAFDLYMLLAKEFIMLRSHDNKKVTDNDMVDLLHARVRTH